MKVIAFYTLAFLVVGGSFLAHRLVQGTVPTPQKPVLIQRYDIRASRDFTNISATVEFRDITLTKQYGAQKVEFNGQLMENDFRDDSKEIDGGCQINIKGPLVRTKPTPKPQPDKSVFSLFQEGYRTDNVVTIYGENSVSESYTLSFEPVEFAPQDPIVLSRSKDNVVRLRGKGSADNRSPVFGLSWQGNFIDEKSFRYEKENDLLFISAQSLKKMKNGNANLWIISSDSNKIETPGLLAGNSYLISYHAETCVQIKD